MQVISTQAFDLADNTSGDTDDISGTAVSIERARAVGVVVTTDITTTGEATINIYGYDGTNWVLLDSTTKAADSVYEAWNRAYPTFTQIKADIVDITNAIAVDVNLVVVV